MSTPQSTSPAAEKSKPRNPNIPSPVDMLSTPIGPIPCAASGDEVIRFPEYFEGLKAAAGIVYRSGSWAIVQEEHVGTQRHDRFIMLLDAAKILIEKWLFANGHKDTAEKLHGVFPDDLLRIAMGMQNQARVRIGQEIVVATTGKMTELHALTINGVADWLMVNSRDPKYREGKKRKNALPDL